MDDIMWRCNENVKRSCTGFSDVQKVLISKCELAFDVAADAGYEENFQDSLKVGTRN